VALTLGDSDAGGPRSEPAGPPESGTAVAAPPAAGPGRGAALARSRRGGISKLQVTGEREREREKERERERERDGEREREMER
jgi:hypothetical protein